MDTVDTIPDSGRTILVVDDDSMVLQMVTIMLQRLGHIVLVASSPDEAIHLVRRSVNKIDLVITDIIMPEMSGKELAKSLKAIKPDMKFMYMSGYTANIILGEKQLFIPKPFSKKKLTEKVHEALEGDIEQN